MLIMTLKYVKKLKGATEKNGAKNDMCKHSPTQSCPCC